jgi:effector-binding domain-containing protein
MKLAVLGPVVFFYHGADGNPATRFRLEIGLPVREAAGTPESPRYFKQAEKFRCLSTTHKGPMAGITAAWSGIVHEALALGHKMNGEGREVYHIWESPDSAINVTELQIGI